MSTHFCPECGISIDNDIRFCPNCGTDQQQGQTPYQPQPQPQSYGRQTAPTYGYQPRVAADPSKGINPVLGIAIFLLPLIGLVTYFIYKSDRPRASSQSCSIAVAGLVVSLFFNFLLLA